MVVWNGIHSLGKDPLNIDFVVLLNHIHVVMIEINSAVLAPQPAIDPIQPKEIPKLSHLVILIANQANLALRNLTLSNHRDNPISKFAKISKERD